jgi:hypothetical protein
MKDDPFKALKDIMNEGKDRWAKIEGLTEKVRGGNQEDMASLLVLLVEHLRPLYSAQEQKLDFDAVLKKLLKK